MTFEFPVFRGLLWGLVLVVSPSMLAIDQAQAAPKKFSSPVVTRKTKDHQTAIEVDIAGAKSLYLEVTDGGDGTSYDWADWIEPRLIGPQGTLRLTELKWKSVVGKAFVGRNQGGKPLRVAGKEVAFGIGTHAKSVILYDLPAGYTTFRARGGLDHGGTDQAGSTTSVRFRVYTSAAEAGFDDPPAVQLLPGFQAELLYSNAVSEIGSWVVLGIDGKGRLLTSDRLGPMYRIVPPPLGSKEKARVEKLTVEVGSANGILEAFGALYVVGKGSGSWQNKSGLFRLRDTTGDDHYDQVEFLIPLHVGSDHHAHAVIVGPRGKRLFILCGNSTDVPSEIGVRQIQHQDEDHLLPRSTYYGHNTGRKAPGGFIISCLPDGSDGRLFCAGFRNPYDFALNADGEFFTWDADMEYDVGGPWYRPTRVNHSVSGGEYGWRFGAGKWPTYYPDTVGRVCDLGRGSPTGVVFGYGAKFPAKYQQALFLCDWTYGRIFALHLKESGASYTGEAEEFISGRGMPVSDIVIRPQDGAMYYITGGRRNPTSLYRITYGGEAATDPAKTASSDQAAIALRAQRKALEAYHGTVSRAARDAAWPQLANPDRAIRYAARTILEHHPVEHWAEEGLAETRPLAIIEVAVAGARLRAKQHQTAILKMLDQLDISKLELEQQLDLLRAYALNFIRLGAPDELTAKRLATRLSPLYPSHHASLDHELCQMLLYLNAPGAVERSMRLLLADQTQSGQMFYAYHLRTISRGWSSSDLEAYFSWMLRAQSQPSDYTGGGHFTSFLKMIREESLKGLSAEQQQSLKSILAEKPTLPRIPELGPRKFVSKWTVDDLTSEASRAETGRSYIRGKRLYTGLCSKCHLLQGQGGALGPDLTSTGNKLKYEALLTEIIEPSKVLSDQYASVILELDSGKVIVGREVGGDDTVLKLVINPDRPTEITQVKKSSIVLKKKSPVSLMPLGLLNTLTKDEILDLLMYVSSGGRVGHTAFDK